MVMKFMRKRKNMRAILWIVAILIIPGFVIWGVGLGGGPKGAYYAAMVNREPIILRDYYRNLNEMEQQYRKIFGENSSDFLKNLNIERIVLENMIRETLLLQQARRRRIRVLDSEVVETIKSDPVFHDEEGRFDPQKYRDIISFYPSEELRKIEDEVRNRIMVDKLREQVISEASVSISEEEIDQYIKNHQITDADRESIRRTLQWQKSEEAFNKWYENVRRNSNIEIYLSLEKAGTQDEELAPAGENE